MASINVISSASHQMDGASLITNGAVYVEAIEPFMVEVHAPEEAWASHLLYLATNAYGLPVVWSPHPTIPGLNALQFIPEPKGAGKIRVLVRYVNTMTQVYLRGGCALEQITTDMDVNNVPILVSNEYSPSVPAKDRTVQSGVVTALRARPCFVCERVVPDAAFGGINPVQWAATYGGTVNLYAVTIRGVTFRAGELLCENFGYDSDQFAGVAWRVAVEFRGNPAGHNPEVAWIDRETGEPGSALTKDPNFDNTTSPLARVCANASDPRYGRKVIASQRAVDWSPLISLFG